MLQSSRVQELVTFHQHRFRKQFTARKEDSSLTLLGPVVQSIVSLTSSLRGQLVKCFNNFITKYTDFFVEKMSAKASHLFLTKNIGIFEILTFEILMKR